jgi:hypothetical protein
MTNPQPDDEPNEFSALDTMDLLAAFLHAKYGEQALRQVLSQLPDLYREPLEDTAGILAAKGLSHVANIVADIAAGLPSEITACPYETGSINARYWCWSWNHKRRQASGEIGKSLRQQAAAKRRGMH